MGDLTVANQATSPSAPGAGFRRLYPKADGWYEKDSADVESRLGVDVLMQSQTWSFDVATADADPGAGLFRLNDAVQEDSLFLYINKISAGGLDLSFLISKLRFANHLLIQDRVDTASSHLLKITGNPILSGNYYKVPILVESSGATALGDTRECAFVFAYSQLDTPFFHFLGARLSWDSVSSVTIGTAGKNSYVADSTQSANISWSGVLTASIAGSGANGLDTGTEAANTWYAVHVIGDTTGVNPTASLLSTSATAPTLPAGYNVFRRVGYVRNNATSNFIQFRQTGIGRSRAIYYDNVIEDDTRVLTGGAATTWTTVNCAAFVGPGSTRVELFVQLDNGGVVGNDFGLRNPSDTISVNGFDYMTDSQFGFELQDLYRSRIDLNCNASQQIQYIWETAGASADLSIRRWVDDL